MYLYDKNRITYFAETDRRNKRVPFGIKAEDRTRHMYIIGKTGMGKSTLIENMVVQDIKNGEGFAFLDPHGKSAALILDYIPPERIKDVVYFAPFDVDNPISFNVMEDVGPDKRHLVANGLLSAFKKIWGPETFSARMEYILTNALLALLEYPGSTLLGVSRMLTDKAYRKKIVDNVKDPSVRAYWVDEFAKYSENYAKDAVPGIQNKLGQFTSNPLIRNIIGQPHSSFDLRKMMDERKILIVNLSKGQLGEGNANLLGGMIITKIYLAAMSRADLTEGELKKLPNFYMYVDEFQSFANESFADILSEARKYKLALIVAHQYIKQMDEKVADAVFGNVGTQIMFRVGAPDAEFLEKEYAPVFTAEDMVSLGFTQIYLKLMIDGVASHPFSAMTLGPIPLPPKSVREEVLESSRTLYGHPRKEVEKAIADWFAEGFESPASSSEKSEFRRNGGFERPPQKGGETTPQRFVPRGDGYPPRAPYQPSAGQSMRPQERTIPVNRPPLQPQQGGVSQLQGELSRPPEKFKKPFAEALKNIASPEQTKPPLVEEKKMGTPVSSPASMRPQPLSSLARLKPTSVQAGSKTPSAGNLSGLKAALSGVLEEKKAPVIVEKKTSERTEGKQPLPQEKKIPQYQSEIPRPQPVVPQRQTESIPVVSNISKKPEPVLEKPFVSPVVETPRVVPPPPQEEQPKKPREVPEDVLTAILRGDE